MNTVTTAEMCSMTILKLSRTLAPAAPNMEFDRSVHTVMDGECCQNGQNSLELLVWTGHCYKSTTKYHTYKRNC